MRYKYKIFSKICLDRTLYRTSISLIQTHCKVLSYQFKCILKFSKPNTCLKQSNSTVQKRFDLDRLHYSCIHLPSLGYGLWRTVSLQRKKFLIISVLISSSNVNGELAVVVPISIFRYYVIPFTYLLIT